MKIRSDYVSNSSSSSFVIANCELIDHFNITKQDILDALIDTYGRDDYKRNVKQREKYAKEHPEYHKKELKYGHFGPFWVYDMEDKADRKEAIDLWGNLLKGWDANNCRKITDEDSEADKGKIASGSEYSTYREIMDKLYDVYGISFWDIREYAVNPIKKNMPTRFVRSDKKDPKTGCYGHYVPVEKEILDFALKLRKDMGIMTNLEVIKSKVAKFFVHADDNELCGEKLSENGNGEEHWDAEKKDYVPGTGKWETKSYTFDRLCEIILEYLEKKGRVNLNDQAFMDMMRIDEKYLSAFDKEHGELWDFTNGKNFTWKDLKHDALTWNLHEG